MCTYYYNVVIKDRPTDVTICVEAESQLKAGEKVHRAFHDMLSRLPICNVVDYRLNLIENNSEKKEEKYEAV